MESLRVASSCSKDDGNPQETSDRVRAAAVAALEHCLCCFKDLNPPPPPPAPVKEPPAREGSGPAKEGSGDKKDDGKAEEKKDGS